MTGGDGADDLDFSVDLTRSTATFHTPEILYIIHRNSYTTQGDPDSSFPLQIPGKVDKFKYSPCSDW